MAAKFENILNKDLNGKSNYSDDLRSCTKHIIFGLAETLFKHDMLITSGAEENAFGEKLSQASVDAAVKNELLSKLAWLKSKIEMV